MILLLVFIFFSYELTRVNNNWQTNNIQGFNSLKFIFRKEVSNPGLTRVKDLKIYEVPDQGCFFQPVNVRMLDTTEPLSVQECKFHVENFNDLVSFRGIIRSKRFTDLISPRTVKNSTIYGFGTPGTINLELQQFKIIVSLLP